MRDNASGAVPASRWDWPQDGPVAQAADLVDTERHSEGLDELRRLADAGDIDATAYLGWYLDANSYDFKEATRLLEAAAARGHPDAMFRLGDRPEEEYGGEPADQIRLLRAAAAQGHLEAVIALGQRFLWDGDEEAALEWLRAAASLDDRSARSKIRAILASRPQLLEQFADLQPPDPYTHGWEVYYSGDHERAQDIWSSYDAEATRDSNAILQIAHQLEGFDRPAAQSWWRRLRLHHGNNWEGVTWIVYADNRLRRLAAADEAEATAAAGGLNVSCVPVPTPPYRALLIFPVLGDAEQEAPEGWETELDRILEPVLARYSDLRWSSQRARGSMQVPERQMGRVE